MRFWNNLQRVRTESKDLKAKNDDKKLNIHAYSIFSRILYTVYIELPAYANSDNPYLQQYNQSVMGQLLKALLVVLQLLHILYHTQIIVFVVCKFIM
jgi:hypothetical protein